MAGRSSALTTAQSPSPWLAKTRALAAAYSSQARVAVQVIRRERLSSTAIHGWNVAVVSSWKLLTSTT